MMVLNQFIVLLRSVNVGGNNIIKMSEIRDLLEKNHFQNVKTYIQSGNIILSSEMRKMELKISLQKLIKDNFGLTLTIFITQVEALEKILNRSPFSRELLPNRIFITFMDKTVSPLLIDEVKNMDLGKEVFYVEGNILYYYLPDGMAKSKLNNSFFERKWNVKCTGRNVKTIEKLIEMSRQF